MKKYKSETKTHPEEENLNQRDQDLTTSLEH